MFSDSITEGSGYRSAALTWVSMQRTRHSPAQAGLTTNTFQGSPVDLFNKHPWVFTVLDLGSRGQNRQESVSSLQVRKKNQESGGAKVCGQAKAGKGGGKQGEARERVCLLCWEQRGGRVAGGAQ